MNHEAKTRAEFAAMRRALHNGFRKHDPAYSADELAALERGENREKYTAEELAELLPVAPKV
jgi:hypothetical protein